MKSEFLIGTRGSKLAIYQAELVKTKLEQVFPLLRFTLVRIKTSGDMIRHSTPDPFSTKRVYTREIEEALEKKEIDIAVHSAKDLAVELPKGLVIAAVLEREDSRDCLVSREGKKLSELPLGARIGTSSIRRRLQLLRLNPDLVIEEIRGNVDTRVRKLEEGIVDALVLAYAGLKRLGLTQVATEIFSEEKFYPAPCQGAIVVETRENDAETREMLHPLNHRESAFQVACERAFLRRLEGGCQLPCGISTHLEGKGEKLRASGILFSLDGSQHVEAKIEAVPENPEGIGLRLAEEILEKGGGLIIQRMR
ncbi:MAG: hydroxymethylbilane synthase [Candidatus Omnitrophica bacterium]|nr:hydroxymethylbilane synthase [Candidatus Omnitrophota bacterium]